MTLGWTVPVTQFSYFLITLKRHQAMVVHDDGDQNNSEYYHPSLILSLCHQRWIKPMPVIHELLRKQESSIPSWCLVWSVSPLRSGPGTLGNCESETDASCLRSKQPTNNFPSQKICTRTQQPLQTLSTARHSLLITVTATAQRSDSVSSGLRILSYTIHTRFCTSKPKHRLPR